MYFQKKKCREHKPLKWCLSKQQSSFHSTTPMGKLGIRILVPLKQMERKEEGAIKKSTVLCSIYTHSLFITRDYLFPWHHTSGIAGCFVAHTRTHAHVTRIDVSTLTVKVARLECPRSFCCKLQLHRSGQEPHKHEKEARPLGKKIIKESLETMSSLFPICLAAASSVEGIHSRKAQILFGHQPCAAQKGADPCCRP